MNRADRRRMNRKEKRGNHVHILTTRPGKFLMFGGFGSFGETAVILAYTKRDDAALSANTFKYAMHMPHIGVQPIPALDFLGGVLEGLPKQGVGVLLLNNFAVPLTKSGALLLCQGLGWDGVVSLPGDEWSRLVEDGSWKLRALYCVLEQLGMDLGGVDPDKLNEQEQAQRLHLLWQQVGGGKTGWGEA